MLTGGHRVDLLQVRARKGGEESLILILGEGGPPTLIWKGREISCSKGIMVAIQEVTFTDSKARI